MYNPRSTGAFLELAPDFDCAAGGYTLDYGPFGFCEAFDTEFQPWTGGGQHFSFLNQPTAAKANFHMFWTAVRPLLLDHSKALEKFDNVRRGFAELMGNQLQTMWAEKLGMAKYDHELFKKLLPLMENSKVDDTIFFRELSSIPDDIIPLKKSFYVTTSQVIDDQWGAWLETWKNKIKERGDFIEVSKKNQTR